MKTTLNVNDMNVNNGVARVVSVSLHWPEPLHGWQTHHGHVGCSHQGALAGGSPTFDSSHHDGHAGWKLKIACTLRWPWIVSEVHWLCIPSFNHPSLKNITNWFSSKEYSFLESVSWRHEIALLEWEWTFCKMVTRCCCTGGVVSWCLSWLQMQASESNHLSIICLEGWPNAAGNKVAQFHVRADGVGFCNEIHYGRDFGRSQMCCGKWRHCQQAWDGEWTTSLRGIRESLLVC